MLRAYAFIIIFGLTYFSSLFVESDLIGLDLYIIGIIGLIIGLAISIMTALWKWRKLSQWIGPALLSLCFLNGMGAATSIRAWENGRSFQSDLLIYDSIVDRIKDGTVAQDSILGPVSGSDVQVLLHEKHLLAATPVQIVAARSYSGAVLLEVFLESTPLEHSGYLYKNYENDDIFIPKSMKLPKNFHLTPLVENWYSFAD